MSSPPNLCFSTSGYVFVFSSFPPCPPPSSGLFWDSARSSSPSSFLPCLFIATEFEGFPSRSLVSPVRTWPRAPSCHFPIPSPFPDQYFQDRFLFLSSYVFLMPSSVTESLIDLRARGPDLAFVHENTVEHTCHLMQRSAPLLLSLCSGFLSVNMMKTL